MTAHSVKGGEELGIKYLRAEQSGSDTALSGRLAHEGKGLMTMTCNPQLLSPSLVQTDRNPWIFVDPSGLQFLHLPNEINNVIFQVRSEDDIEGYGRTLAV